MSKRKSKVNVILSKATELEPRHQAGTILPFDDGRLLLAYSHFYDRDANDGGPARIVGRWSNDEGDSWSEAFILQENIGNLNCMTPSLARLRSGRILLEFLRKDANPSPSLWDRDSDEAGILHPMVKFSDDGGKTWSNPTQITEGAAYWCSCHDRLLVIHDGRVLLPIFAKNGVSCWMSNDGETWRRGEGVLRCPGKRMDYHEPIIAEISDGRLKMWIRNRGKRYAVAVSGDQGETWSLCDDWGLNGHNAPCMVRRIPESGDLLVIWNNNQIRTPLNCAISRDEGETWTNIKALEPMCEWPTTHQHAYPSLTFLNGFAHITYYESERRAVSSDNELLGPMLSLKYRRLPVSWFYE